MEVKAPVEYTIDAPRATINRHTERQIRPQTAAVRSYFRMLARNPDVEYCDEDTRLEMEAFLSNLTGGGGDDNDDY